MLYKLIILCGKHSRRPWAASQSAPTWPPPARRPPGTWRRGRCSPPSPCPPPWPRPPGREGQKTSMRHCARKEKLQVKSLFLWGPKVRTRKIRNYRLVSQKVPHDNFTLITPAHENCSMLHNFPLFKNVNHLSPLSPAAPWSSWACLSRGRGRRARPSWSAPWTRPCWGAGGRRAGTERVLVVALAVAAVRTGQATTVRARLTAS